MTVPARQIRATFTTDTITVYQAYPPDIAEAALAAGRFVPPFKRERMTWIKPSFRWMLYRCGYAAKPGQERVLAVRISRAGFEWALANSCASGFDPHLHTDRADWSRRLRTSPVRSQWDPERSLRLAPLPHRSLQVGLSGAAVDRYVDDWLVDLTDVTPLARVVRERLAAGDEPGAAAVVPVEHPYPLSAELARLIGASSPGEPEA